MGRPRPDMHTSLTSIRSKVKVTGLLKFRKLHFSRSISSAILSWSSILMVDDDSMGPGLQHVGAWFLNFLLRKLPRKFRLRRMSILHEFQRAIFPYCVWIASHSWACWQCYTLCMLIWAWLDPMSRSRSWGFWSSENCRKLHFARSIFFEFPLRKLLHEFKLCGMSILHEFQMAIFPYCLRLLSHGRHAVSPICTAHADMILISSKVKVKVTELLNFLKLHFSTSASFAILAWSSKLMVGYDSMGPSLQLFGSRFLNFPPIWRPHDFQVPEILISPESTGFYLYAA